MRRAATGIATIMSLITIMTFSVMPVFAVGTEIVSLDIKADTVSIEEGSVEGLKVSYSYAGDAPTEGVTWSSSNKKVAKVIGGTVTALHAGTAAITAELGGCSDTCEVTVTEAKSSWIDARKCYTLLNKDRKAQHSSKIKPLKRDKALEKIAKKRAKEMAISGKFSHTRPNGKSSVTLIKGNKAKGENIAMGQRTCKAVTEAWYASPGHRRNMLRKCFHKVGIAGYTYKGVTYWAEVFSS